MHESHEFLSLSAEPVLLRDDDRIPREDLEELVGSLGKIVDVALVVAIQAHPIQGAKLGRTAGRHDRSIERHVARIRLRPGNPNLPTNGNDLLGQAVTGVRQDLDGGTGVDLGSAIEALNLAGENIGLEAGGFNRTDVPHRDEAPLRDWIGRVDATLFADGHTLNGDYDGRTSFDLRFQTSGHERQCEESDAKN